MLRLWFVWLWRRAGQIRAEQNRADTHNTPGDVFRLLRAASACILVHSSHYQQGRELVIPPIGYSPRPPATATPPAIASCSEGAGRGCAIAKETGWSWGGSEAVGAGEGGREAVGGGGLGWGSRVCVLDGTVVLLLLRVLTAVPGTCFKILYRYLREEVFGELVYPHRCM